MWQYVCISKTNMKSQIIEVTLPRYQHIKLSFVVLAHWINDQQIDTYIYSNTLFCLVIVLSLQFCVFSSETTNTSIIVFDLTIFCTRG